MESFYDIASQMGISPNDKCFRVYEMFKKLDSKEISSDEKSSIIMQIKKMLGKVTEIPRDQHNKFKK